MNEPWVLPQPDTLTGSIVHEVVNLAYNYYLLRAAGIPLTIGPSDWANMGLAFTINVPLAVIGSAVAFSLACGGCGRAEDALVEIAP